MPRRVARLRKKGRKIPLLIQRGRRTRLPARGRERGMQRAARIAIYRASETKERRYANTSVAIGVMGNSSWNAAGAAGIFPLTPNTTSNKGIDILQGTGEGNRVGNSIRVSKAVFRFYLSARGYDASSNPIPRPSVVKYWIVSVKQGIDFNDLADVQNLSLDFFETTNGTTGTFADLRDTMMPINNDKYVVHKTGEIKVGYADFTGTGNQTNSQFFANNDFKLYSKRSIDVTKYIPKQIRYVDNNSQPTTKPVWIIFSAYPADGSTAGNELPVNMNQVYDFKYKDL